MTTILEHEDIDETGEEIEGVFEASDKPTNDGMEFHVQMKGYQLRGFEEAVIQAAARVLAGKHNETTLAREIEAACISMLSNKIDDALRPVTEEILNHPMIADPFAAKADPVTLRQFIGLCGREFLEQHVDSNGKPCKYSPNFKSETRVVRLLRQIIDQKFQAEVEKATTEIINLFRTAVLAEQSAMLAAEKARIREALLRTVAGEEDHD